MLVFSLLYLLFSVSLFILVVAGINFINLSMANLFNRGKEVGVRKIMGAYKKQLLVQFFCEALVIVVMAFAIAILVIYVAIPYFNAIFKDNLGCLGG